ncbi:malonate decarboxylase holo-ACP synthase [Streptomyces umbrinus]|uniref:malonate decarboxylase holo-ACP synthase n=1 Tax=Streptomyces umbrinus TaxID=67370 RepID=UPI003C2D2E41
MPYEPHDLLRVDSAEVVEPAPDPRGPARSGMREALTRAPWVVVRRDRAPDGLVPVGVRGAGRADRWAAFVQAKAVREQVSPQQLADRPAARRANRVPALDALARVARVLEGRQLVWGPGGGGGFELATGLEVLSEDSDVDLVLCAPEPLPVPYVARLLRDLSDAAAPVRADVQLLTPLGGVSAAEYAGGGDVLLRTDRGPRIVRSPWRASISQARSPGCDESTAGGHRR